MIRLAVIGLKHGKAHIENIYKLKDRAKLVALCAAHKTASRDLLASKYNVPFYTDYRLMITETKPDGVIICTPNHLHLEEVLFCAKRGVDVLIEKPIADTVENGKLIVDAINQSGISALVGYHRRFSPKLNLAKKLIDSGKIGTPIGASVIWVIHKPDEYFGSKDTPSWQTKYELGGGPLMINASHEIDSLRYLFGDIEEVQGVSNNAIRKFNLEDTAAISVKFKSGFIASILISDCSPSLTSYENTVGENHFYYQYEENCCFFFGTEATLMFPSFNLIKHPDIKGWQYPVTKENVSDLNLSNLEADPLYLEMVHFCEMIENKSSPFINVNDGLQTLIDIEKLRKCFDSSSVSLPNKIKPQ